MLTMEADITQADVKKHLPGNSKSAKQLRHPPLVAICSNLLSIDCNDWAIHPVRQMMGELAAHVP